MSHDKCHFRKDQVILIKYEIRVKARSARPNKVIRAYKSRAFFDERSRTKKKIPPPVTVKPLMIPITVVIMI